MSRDPLIFWAELKRRRVVRVAVVYAVVGWGVVEVSKTLSEILELPASTPRLVLALVTLLFPAALIASWMFDVTGEGIQRVERTIEGNARSSQWPFAAGLAIGIASVSGAVALLLLGGAEHPITTLDDERVAIVPFQYSGPPDLEYLGEGIVHLIAPRFDGELAPRSLDPASSTAVWRDLTSREPGSPGDEVAEALGAGHVLTGAVITVGDRLTLNASLRSVGEAPDLATAHAEGHVDSLPSVVDRLTAELLALNAGEDRPSLAQLTSTSPEALREYLLGQQAARRAEFELGVEHFRRAVQIDSTFALAAIAWIEAGNNALDSDSDQAYELAWRNRDRLDERDRAYLDALYVPQYPEGHTIAEHVAVYEELLRSQPDRAYAWYFLGEESFHAGYNRGAGWLDRMRGYFEESLRRDPQNGAAATHVFYVDLLGGDIDAIAESATRVAGFPSEGERAALARTVLIMLDPDTTGFETAYSELLAQGGGIDYLIRFPTVFNQRWMVDEAERSIQAFLDFATTRTELRRAYRWGYLTLLAFGRPREADAFLSQIESAPDQRVFHEMRLMDAAYGALPVDLGEAAARVHEEQLRGTAPEDRSVDDVRSLFRLALWRLSQGDASRSVEAIGDLRSAMGWAIREHAMSFEVAAYFLEADLAQRDGDRARAFEALRRMHLVYDQGITLGRSINAGLHFALADLYERLDAPDAALAALEREIVFNNNDPHAAEYMRERARLSAILGDTASAIRGYRQYLLIRSNAEPELAQDIRGVQAALADLTGS